MPNYSVTVKTIQLSQDPDIQVVPIKYSSRLVSYGATMVNTTEGRLGTLSVPVYGPDSSLLKEDPSSKPTKHITLADSETFFQACKVWFYATKLTFMKGDQASIDGLKKLYQDLIDGKISLKKGPRSEGFESRWKECVKDLDLKSIEREWHRNVKQQVMQLALWNKYHTNRAFKAEIDALGQLNQERRKKNQTPVIVVEASQHDDEWASGPDGGGNNLLGICLTALADSAVSRTFSFREYIGKCFDDYVRHIRPYKKGLAHDALLGQESSPQYVAYQIAEATFASTLEEVYRQRARLEASHCQSPPDQALLDRPHYKKLTHLINDYSSEGKMKVAGFLRLLREVWLEMPDKTAEELKKIAFARALLRGLRYTDEDREEIKMLNFHGAGNSTDLSSRFSPAQDKASSSS